MRAYQRVVKGTCFGLDPKSSLVVYNKKNFLFVSKIDVSKELSKAFVCKTCRCAQTMHSAVKH